MYMNLFYTDMFDIKFQIKLETYETYKKGKAKIKRYKLYIDLFCECYFFLNY